MRLVAVLVGLVAGLVLAGTPVDQGKPGTQGAWPVQAVSGGWVPDGGPLGYVTVVQGPGVDGGSAWNVGGSVGTSAGAWELVNEFDVAAWLVTDGGLTTSARIALGYPPDGGAWTWEYAGATTPTTLMTRVEDVPGSGLMVQAYIASNGGTGSMTVTLRQYAYAYPSDTTIGASSVYTQNVVATATNAASFVAFGGGGTQVSLWYPMRPPALSIVVSGATLTNATAAKVRLWRLP